MATLAPGASIGEIAEIIHAAVLLGPAAWGREPMPEAHLKPDIEEKLKSQLRELFGLLDARQIPYVLVGGIAMLTYVQGRNTKDVDLVISLASLKLLPEVVISSQDHEFARGTLGNLQIDFLLTDNPLFDLVQKKYARSQPFLETDIRCATIEGLLLLKLYALPSLYLQGNFDKVAIYEADIAMLCKLNQRSVDPLLKVLEPMVTEGQLTELENIVAEIQQRIARFDRVKKPRP